MVPLDSNKPSIGVLYVCTGKYAIFWDDFYFNSKKYLFTDCDITFFVFTDNQEILETERSDVVCFSTNAEPWPFPTLMRYRTFLSVEPMFNCVDYLLFCNANLRFNSSINYKDVFGTKGLFATVHPGYEGKMAHTFPYENNPMSRAYTEIRAKEYVCGGFNGGKKGEFLDLCRTLNDRIHEDLADGIIAIWHDETHFNRFYAENIQKFNLISSDYCFPEGWDDKRLSRVTVLNKEHFIGVSNKGGLYVIKYYGSKIAKYLKLILKAKG